MDRTLLALILAFLLVPLSRLSAVELVLQSNQPEYGVGEEFLVDLYMNTDGEMVNAVEGEVVVSGESIEILDISDGNSSINFWVNRPTLVGNKISFSGIVPGGLSGREKKVLTIRVKAKSVGTTELLLSSLKVLKNDGSGTELRAKVGSLKLGVVEGSKKAEIKLEDIDPPEDFLPFVGRDPELFEGRYFLVFYAQDKGVGIDKYEVKEGIWGEYVEAESPYLLENQELDKKIYVRAHDELDNKRTVVVRPENYVSWYKNPLILGIIIGVLVLGWYRNKRWLEHSSYSS